MVFVMLLMIGFGCSKETKVVNTRTVAQEIDNKTLEVKSQILAPWEERKKNFWISVYFARMSYQPNIRERFLPHILYGVCECIIGELEKASRTHKGQSERLATILSVLKGANKNG